jgi:hypothetical protein
VLYCVALQPASLIVPFWNSSFSQPSGSQIFKASHTILEQHEMTKKLDEPIYFVANLMRGQTGLIQSPKRPLLVTSKALVTAASAHAFERTSRQEFQLRPHWRCLSNNT